MAGTYFGAESAYFKREKDDSRDILTAFKDRRRFLDISNYEKQKKKISCHMHFKRGRYVLLSLTCFSIYVCLQYSSKKCQILQTIQILEELTSPMHDAI